MQQALQLVDEAGQSGGGAGQQQRRDIGLVQLHAFVGAHLGDAGEADAGEALACLALQCVAQAQLADRQDGGVLEAGIGVGGLVLADGEARHGLHAVGRRGFHAAGLAGGQDQVNRAVAGDLRQLDRLRVFDVAGDAEGRAVGKDAGGAAQRELAQGEQVGVDLHLGQAVGEGAQPGGAAAHQAFDVAVLLLEVLRLEEQALRPDDLVLPAHAQGPGLAAMPARVAVTVTVVVLCGGTSTSARHFACWKSR